MWAIWAAFSLVHPAPAQDRVTILDRLGREVVRSGEVLEYNARELRFRTRQGQETQFAADRVRRVETPRTPTHESADELFGRHLYVPALANYREALQTESRRWVKRHLWAQTVRCQRNLGQIEQAASAFLVLLKEDPQTRDLDAIPLAWTAGEGNAALEQQLRAWLTEPARPWPRLIAASWLLTGHHRAVARMALERLAQEDDPRIAQLARLQRWRTEVATATSDQVMGWERQLEDLSEPLRAGPNFVVGQAYSRLGSVESATLTLLRVPILYPHHRHLAAEALSEAARLLQSSGRSEQARRLQLELIRDYPGTVAAGHAQRQMQ